MPVAVRWVWRQTDGCSRDPRSAPLGAQLGSRCRRLVARPHRVRLHCGTAQSVARLPTGRCLSRPITAVATYSNLPETLSREVAYRHGRSFGDSAIAFLRQLRCRRPPTLFGVPRTRFCEAASRQKRSRKATAARGPCAPSRTLRATSYSIGDDCIAPASDPRRACQGPVPCSARANAAG